jgi:hypothetical protein
LLFFTFLCPHSIELVPFDFHFRCHCHKAGVAPIGMDLKSFRWLRRTRISLVSWDPFPLANVLHPRPP